MRQADSAWDWLDCLYVLYDLLRLSPVLDESYDVIHAHGYGHKVPVACSLLHVTAPVILTIHSYHSAQFGFGDRKQKVRQYNAINRNADAIIHVSHADRRKGRDLGVEWNCPDFVIHNAIEVGKEKLSDTKRDGICFVGSLIRRKGLDLLIEAWNECETVGALRIIGKGPLSEKIESEVGRTCSVRILGYLEKEEDLRQMRRSNALVVPSRSESFGLVYLEALLMGTPIVGYHQTLNEFISVLSPTDEELDYIHPFDASKGSVDNLSEAIESAVAARRSDQEGRVAQGLIQKIRQHFSWDRIIPELESVYKQVTEDCRLQENRG
jgi:glycosyltransferase involved in cell wall biosynthesis